MRNISHHPVKLMGVILSYQPGINSSRLQEAEMAVSGTNISIKLTVKILLFITRLVLIIKD